MAGYEILFKDSVFKDLQAIPKTDLRKILSRIERLADDPRPAGSQKLTGADLYRVRQGVYRIVYSIHDRTMVIHVVKVGHRKEVYRYIVPTGKTGTVPIFSPHFSHPPLPTKKALPIGSAGLFLWGCDSFGFR